MAKQQNPDPDKIVNDVFEQLEKYAEIFLKFLRDGIDVIVTSLGGMVDAIAKFFS